MINKKTSFKMCVFLVLALNYPLPVFASQYACSIKSVLQLSDVGLLTDHGWVANYLNRKFFVDRDTGKVVGATALKARLTNFDKTYSPKVLINTEEKSSYKVVTVFEDKGQFSSLRIYDNVASSEKPYTYQTAVGMLITGTCLLDNSK